MKQFLLVSSCALLVVAGCGGDSKGNDGDAGVLVDDAGNPIDDAGNPITDGAVPDAFVIPTPDGGFGGGCAADQPECNNCIDDDMDGNIDSADVECTGAQDNDESSFATGIPGDNKDPHQDCFFDGDSGAGNDGCKLNHYCCPLADPANCPENNFDPSKDCGGAETECIENCGAAAPAGCDCFGCCTVCVGTDCRDITLNPALAPDCDETTILDETKCLSCNKVVECGGETCNDDPTDCILCPGQTEADLPPECSGTNECPGTTTCTQSSDCGSGLYCGAGCCLNIIE